MALEGCVIGSAHRGAGAVWCCDARENKRVACAQSGDLVISSKKGNKSSSEEAETRPKAMVVGTARSEDNVRSGARTVQRRGSS